MLEIRLFINLSSIAAWRPCTWSHGTWHEDARWQKLSLWYLAPMRHCYIGTLVLWYLARRCRVPWGWGAAAVYAQRTI